MGDSLRDLARTLASIEWTRAWAGDCDELARATSEWLKLARADADPYQLRRSYSAIDLSWHRLRDQTSSWSPDALPPVDQADAALHEALNLIPRPYDLEGSAAAPTGLKETRRLAYAMAQRAEATAATVESAYGRDQKLAKLIADAKLVARMADAFTRGLCDPKRGADLDQALKEFVPLYQKSVGLGVVISANQPPDRLRSQWLSQATALILTRSSLMTTSASVHPIPPPPNSPDPTLATQPPPRLKEWADALVRQADELFARFDQTCQLVPEGLETFLDLERLRDDAKVFQAESTKAHDLAAMAFRFREVDSDWQRLGRRMNRIDRLRTGPNLQPFQEINQAYEAIHRELGMPGYPPDIPSR